MTLGIGLAMLAGVVVVVWILAPSWQTEMLANILLLGGLFFTASWMWKNSRYGLITTIGLWGFLIMQRLGMLDWISVGAWLAIIGLITLVN
ncbi:MAG: hypothetical protein G01um101416_859 [Microgenomates group bacterium Gr01-1014_16]|nr:MAG: hypothetical protein G01um101416_859 [Microgenomates group bacterium Gr01-1014_16]